MIKKLFLILCALVLCSSSYAGNIKDIKKVIARKNAPCASYYNTANVILSMNFQHTTSKYTACDSSGNAVTFTTGGDDISTYDIGGDANMKMRIDDANEAITLTQTEDQYVNETVGQTVCIEVWITDQFDATAPITIFEEETPNDDYIEVQISSGVTPSTGGEYQPGGTIYAIGVIGVGSWEVIGYSYDRSTADHWANSGEEGTWTTGWDEENDLYSNMTHPITRLKIGTNGTDPITAGGEYIYIRNWALVSGDGDVPYDCNALFNP